MINAGMVVDMLTSVGEVNTVQLDAGAVAPVPITPTFLSASFESPPFVSPPVYA